MESQTNNSPCLPFLQDPSSLPVNPSCNLSPRTVIAGSDSVAGTIVNAGASTTGGTITWAGSDTATFTCSSGTCTIPAKTFATAASLNPTVVLNNGNRVTCYTVNVLAVSTSLAHLECSVICILPVNCIFLMSILSSLK